MTESLPGGCWGIRVMTATRLSQKLLSKTCNLSFPQRGTGVSKENTTNTFIACGTWLKTPFYTSSAGVELPLGTQRIPHPLSLLFKSGAYLCGQMCLHKLVSTLSKIFCESPHDPCPSAHINVAFFLLIFQPCINNFFGQRIRGDFIASTISVKATEIC